MFLPPRKPEAPVEEKPTTLFAIRALKAASALSNTRPSADEGDDIYKTHPVFASIVEPFANKFMNLKELIEVKSFAFSPSYRLR